jgi:sphingolipid delta-4 desaturase
VDKVSAECADSVEERPGASRAGISSQARFHNDLRRRVLDRKPGLASLAGPDWRTAVAAILLLAIHWTTVWTVSRTNLLVVFLVALCFGQFVYHSAATLVHESAHRLVFRNARGKLAFDLVLEAVLTSFSQQLIYQHNHITSHHPRLGDYEGDYEHEDLYRVAARRAYRANHPVRARVLNIAQLVLHLLPYGFITDTVFMPRFLAQATGLPKEDKSRDTGASKPTVGERRLFFFFSLAVHIGLFVCFGFLGWLYHLWSMSLVLGRWGITSRGQFLAEHPGDDTQQPTRSTYWWGNRIFFNTGYHFEHHTFPNVPWTRIRKIKAAAPDVFSAGNDRSYFRFWWNQMKADFELPVRASARGGLEVLNRREKDEAAMAVKSSAAA